MKEQEVRDILKILAEKDRPITLKIIIWSATRNGELRYETKRVAEMQRFINQTLNTFDSQKYSLTIS